MNFYTEIIANDPRFHSTAECRDMALLEPVTRQAVQNILSAAASKGIALEVTETYRSAERQALLFAQGTTQLQTVGVHHYGLAADFGKILDGKASWAGDWSFLRDLAEEFGMISGLDWGLPDQTHYFVDPDHVQRCAVADERLLFAGNWYPDSITALLSPEESA